MKILAVDSTGEALSLALGGGARKTVSRRVRAKAQDEKLFPELKKLLTAAGAGLKDIDAVAAANGPGRFTGIRIGMTFAVMLARALGRPVAALSRFEAAACLMAPAGRRDRICLVIAGMREDRYFQLFRGTVRGALEPAGEPSWASAEEFASALSRSAEGGCPRVVLIEPTSAADLIAPAREKFKSGCLPPPRPLYLKPAGYERPRRG